MQRLYAYALPGLTARQLFNSSELDSSTARQPGLKHSDPHSLILFSFVSESDALGFTLRDVQHACCVTTMLRNR